MFWGIWFFFFFFFFLLNPYAKLVGTLSSCVSFLSKKRKIGKPQTTIRMLQSLWERKTGVGEGTWLLATSHLNPKEWPHMKNVDDIVQCTSLREWEEECCQCFPEAIKCKLEVSGCQASIIYICQMRERGSKEGFQSRYSNAAFFLLLSPLLHYGTWKALNCSALISGDLHFPDKFLTNDFKSC